MTANVNLEMNIDTDLLVQKSICRPFKQSKSNKNFNGVVYKSVATAQIYKNGKINMIGAKSRKQIDQVFHEICKFLCVDQRLFDIVFTNFCATVDFGCDFPREDLHQFLIGQTVTKTVLLEPELFPPIKWDPVGLPSTVNIFRTGKINSTGNKSEHQAFESLKLAVDVISKVSCVDHSEKMASAFVDLRNKSDNIHVPYNQCQTNSSH